MSNALHVEAPEGLPFIDYTREFDAPVEAVFRAHADPELFGRWIGYGQAVLERYDFRTGGGFRYYETAPDGVEYAFRGVFHVVRENEFAIQTFEFEGYPDVVSIESMRFVPLEGGRTRIEGHAVYPSLEARDGMAASGMEEGMTTTYDKLEAVLAAL